MRQHLGLALILLALAAAAGLAWFCIDHSEPGYRPRPAAEHRAELL